MRRVEKEKKHPPHHSRAFHTTTLTKTAPLLADNAVEVNVTTIMWATPYLLIYLIYLHEKCDQVERKKSRRREKWFYEHISFAATPHCSPHTPHLAVSIFPNFLPFRVRPTWISEHIVPLRSNFCFAFIMQI